MSCSRVLMAQEREHNTMVEICSLTSRFSSFLSKMMLPTPPGTQRCSHGHSERLAIEEAKYVDMEHMPWIGGRWYWSSDGIVCEGGC
jgi:hypothetical protein